MAIKSKSANRPRDRGEALFCFSDGPPKAIGDCCHTMNFSPTVLVFDASLRRNETRNRHSKTKHCFDGQTEGQKFAAAAQGSLLRGQGARVEKHGIPTTIP